MSRWLVARERGLYGLRYEQVFGESRRGMASSSLRFSRLGKSVAFHPEPDNGLFGRPRFPQPEQDLLGPIGNGGDPAGDCGGG